MAIIGKEVERLEVIPEPITFPQTVPVEDPTRERETSEPTRERELVPVR